METTLAQLNQEPALWWLSRLGLAALAGWTFAVSCWLPRGSLALPSAALLLGALGLPFWLMYRAAPGYLPRQDHVFVFGGALAIASVAVAWLSFVRGRRQGRGIGAGAWRGLAATGMLLAPAWAYAAIDCEDWNSLDPTDGRCSIYQAFVGEGGRFAYVSAGVEFEGEPVLHVDGRSRWALRSFVVDLETGRWSNDLGPGHAFLPVGETGRAWWSRRRTTPIAVVGRFDQGASGEGGRWMRYYDGATAELITSGWSHLRHEEVERYESRSRRTSPEGYTAVRPCGLGDMLRKDGERFIHDPFRGRVYPESRFEDIHGILVRPGRWLAIARYGGRGERILLDPDTGGVSRVAGAALEGWALLGDGRVIQFDPEKGDVALLDPETGARRDLEANATWVSVYARTPAGASIVAFRSRSPEGDDVVFHARLDPDTAAIRRFPALDGLDCRRSDLIAVLDETTLLCLLDRRRIVRVECDRPELEVLFPRSDDS